MEYEELIKAVFHNAKGEELIDVWQRLYGDRRSYQQGNNPEETAYREGEREFFLHVKQLTEN